MKASIALSEAVGLGSILVLLYFLLALTYAGLTTGIYQIILASNMLFEHYLELALVIVGLILYIKHRRIKFTLHPQRQRNKLLQFNKVLNTKKSIIDC